MSENEKHPIRNDILAGVAVAIIVAVLGFIWLFVPDLLQWLKNTVVSVWTYLLSSIEIARYTLLLLSLLSLAFIATSARNLYKNLVNKLGLNAYKKYKEDKFFDIVWRWSYPFDYVYQLHPFCPECDTSLVCNETNVGRFQPTNTTFYCDFCKRDIARFEGDVEQNLATVKRRIERRLRNGEWKQVVASKSENISNQKYLNKPK